MRDSYEVAPGIHVLPSQATIPGVGILPVNAFLVLGTEPLLVDTGFRTETDEFLHGLWSLVDPADLRYVLVTHDDAEHVGSIERVMEAAPRAQLLTHALGALRMKLTFDIPLERVHAIVPGDELRMGGRTFRVFRPLLYDNPMTLGLHDVEASLMLSVDTFGAILPRWEGLAGDYTAEELARSQLVWAGFDDPWVAHYERSAWDTMLQQTLSMESDLVLSSHLPPAKGLFRQMLETLRTLPDVAPFVPPNQQMFAQIVAAMKAP